MEEATGMDLSELVTREPPVPWSHGGKIPWNDPEFSERMLREHLSQDHDLASRRSERIDAHVAGLHDSVCSDGAAVLELGCGPGLYTSRLARLGHRCVGIDFSPASIEHARAQAERESLDCTYLLGDIREVDFPSGVDVVLLTYGEFNTFRPDDARTLLGRVWECLKPAGVLVLEVYDEWQVESLGRAEAAWHVAERGLFSDEPYLCLKDSRWHEGVRASAERFTVITLSTGATETMVCTTQSYASTEYDALLREARFGDVGSHLSLAGDGSDGDEGLLVLTAVRQRSGRPPGLTAG